MKVKIEVSLKDGVLDPQAKTIFQALQSLGFDSINGLKITKTLTLDLNINDKSQALQQAKEMAESLLANVVIEDYKIEIES